MALFDTSAALSGVHHPPPDALSATRTPNRHPIFPTPATGSWLLPPPTPASRHSCTLLPDPASLKPPSFKRIKEKPSNSPHCEDISCDSQMIASQRVIQHGNRPNLPTLARVTQLQLIYIGETERRLCDRFAEHLRSGRIHQPDLPVAQHFNSPSHSESDLSVLGLLHGQSEDYRKLEEQHLKFRLGSVYPSGMNIDFSKFR